MSESLLILSTVLQSVIEVFFIIALGFVISHPRFLILTPETAVSITNFIFFTIFPVHIFFSTVTSLDVTKLDNLWYIPITTMLYIFLQYLFSEFLFRFNCIQALCFEPKRDQAVHLQVTSTTVPQYFILPYALGMRLLPRLLESLNYHISKDVVEKEFQTISTLFMLPYIFYLFTFVLWYVKNDPTTSEEHWMRSISRKMITSNDKESPEIRTRRWLKSTIGKYTSFFLSKARRLYLPVPVISFLFAVLFSSIPPVNRFLFDNNNVDWNPINSFFTKFLVPFTNSTFINVGLLNIGCQLGTFYYERRIFFERKRRALFSLQDKLLLETSTSPKPIELEEEEKPVGRKLDYESDGEEQEEQQHEEEVISPEKKKKEEKKRFGIDEILPYYNRSFLEKMKGFGTISNRKRKERDRITKQIHEEYTRDKELDKREQFDVIRLGIFNRLSSRWREEADAEEERKMKTVCGFVLELFESVRRCWLVLKYNTIKYNSWLVMLKSVGGKLVVIPFFSLLYVIIMLYLLPNLFMFCTPDNEDAYFRRFVFAFVVVLFSSLPADTISLKMIINYYFFHRHAGSNGFLNNGRSEDELLNKTGIMHRRAGMELKSFCELVLVQYIFAPFTIALFLFGFIFAYFRWIQSL